MNPLFDMLTGMAGNSQGKLIADQMARQFGLQQEQAARAMEALMPAFTQGLQRNATSPQGLAGLMQALATGNHQRYMQNPMEAFTQSGMQEGNAILGHLFGSKDLSRAVAAQAEAASGISQSILKQMLPAMAPMVLGGLFTNLLGGQTGTQAHAAAHPTAQAQSAMGGGGILGTILEQMMRNGFPGGMGMPGGNSGGNAGGQAQPRARNPLEELFEQMTGGRMPGGAGSQPQADGTSPGGPLGDIFTEMLRGGPAGGGYQAPQETPYDAPRDDHNTRNPAKPDLDSIFGQDAPDPRSADRAEKPRSGYPEGTGLDDLFGDLFKPPQGTAPNYQDAIESIFDQFMGKR